MTGWQVRLASLGLMLVLSYALEAYALHLDGKDGPPCGCGCGGCAGDDLDAGNLDEGWDESDLMDLDELRAAASVCGCGGTGPCVCAGPDLAIFESAPENLRLDNEEA